MIEVVDVVELNRSKCRFARPFESPLLFHGEFGIAKSLRGLPDEDGE